MIALTTLQWVSLIAIPSLIVLLVLLLIILLSRKNRSDTVANLAYKLQNLSAACKKSSCDKKALKKLDTEAAACNMLCEIATSRHGQDLVNVPNHLEKARKILHALCEAKTPPEEAKKYMSLVISELDKAYRFLIDILGITAAPKSASIKFFSKNMKSDEAKRYLSSLPLPKDDDKDN